MADFNADFRSGGAEFLLVQNPVGADYYGSASFTVAANVRYWQRVFDAGAGLWCYYSTVNVLDSTPASGATSPNWIGPISTSQVVAATVEP